MIFEHYQTLLTPEQRLCGRILGADWSARAARVWPPLEERIDWSLVPDLAWQYKMRPMVAAALRESDWEIPDEIRVRLESSSRECALRTARHLAALHQVIAASESRGIRFIAMKGLSLSACLYGDPFIREAYDLDILVGRHDFASMATLLSDLGFRSVDADSPLSDRQEAIMAFFRQGNKMIQPASGSVIDLHYKLDANHFRQATDFEALWKQRSSTRVGPHDLPIPPERDMLRLSAAHAARHEWERWKWLGDLAVLLRRARVEQLREERERARHDGFLRALDSSFFLAALVTGVSLPDEIVEAVLSDRRALRLARWALQFSAPGLKPVDVGRPPPLRKIAGQLFVWSSWRSVGFGLLRLIHYERDWRTMRLPDWLIPGYYFYRIFGAVGRRILAKRSRRTRSA